MFLEEIVAAVDRRVDAWTRDQAAIRQGAEALPPPRSLREAVERGRPVGVIAECKHRSPSKGWLTDAYNPVAQAQQYQRLGAAAISVLTEPDYFAGAMEHLAAVRQAVDCPVLCKDFVRDPIQVWQARRHGADAVLLIVRIVPDRGRLRALKQLIEELGMEALIEVHSEAEVAVALSLDPALIGINNRDLDSFDTRLEFSHTIAPLIPPSVTAISESGISEASQVLALEQIGYRGILVGEALMRGGRLLEHLR